MQGLHDTVESILHILSNPAWSGIGSVCSLIGIPLAFLLSRKSKTNVPREAHPSSLSRRSFNRLMHRHFRDNLESTSKKIVPLAFS